MKVRFASLGLLLMLWCGPAFAQGCAMCYSTAAAASKEGQRAVNKAVLVLLIPPVGFMTLGVGMAVRYSKKRDRAQEE
jgi:cytochrome c-type biogenesis protein CcmH/NrfF